MALEGTKIKVDLDPESDEPTQITLTEYFVNGTDRTWYSFGTNPKYGTEVDKLSDTLPTKVQFVFPDCDDPEVAVQDFFLSTGQRLDGRRFVGGEAPIRVPLPDGTTVIRLGSVSISETKRGSWQVRAYSNNGVRDGDGSVDREKERARKLSEKTKSLLS